LVCDGDVCERLNTGSASCPCRHRSVVQVTSWRWPSEMHRQSPDHFCWPRRETALLLLSTNILPIHTHHTLFLTTIRASLFPSPTSVSRRSSAETLIFPSSSAVSRSHPDIYHLHPSAHIPPSPSSHRQRSRLPASVRPHTHRSAQPPPKPTCLPSPPQLRSRRSPSSSATCCSALV
jgi:hypothetical protein